MPRSVKLWFWRVAAFCCAALLAAVLYGGWYVYHYGFTQKWKTLLTAELRERGLDFSATGLTLSPFEGLVAENANLYLLDEHHTHLMSIDRAAVDINFLNLLRKRPFLNSLDLRGTRLWIPIDLGENPPKLRLRRLQAKLIFLTGEVQIAQAEGELQGLQISVSGSLQHPESLTERGGPATSAEERERRREMARAVINEIRQIRSDGSLPRVEARFSGDLAHLETLRAEVQVRGEGIRRGKYRLDTLQGKMDYADGTLRMQSVQLSDARGSLGASGEYSAASGEAHFQLDSTLDLPALVREFVPAAEIMLATIAFHDTPHLRIEDGRVRLTAPAGPTTPQAAPAQSAAIVGSFQVTGHLGLGLCGFRGLELEKAQTDFTWSGDRWYLRNLHFARAGNSGQQVTADILSEPTAARLRLSSTIDPTAVASLLPSRGRAMLAEWRFLDPPHVELKSDGRSFTDLDSFRVNGKIGLGRTRYRGVPLNRLQGDFNYADHALTYRKFTVERDEGIGTGDAFIYDFGHHEARLENIRATLDPAAVSVWIDPDVARAVAPYHFHKAPTTLTNGIVQFDGGRNSRLTVDFSGAAGMDYTFIHRPLNFQSVAGQVLFTDDRLRLNDLQAAIFGGQMRGSLDLSLVKGAPDYAAAIEAEGVDFTRLTKLFFGYDASKGVFGGDYHFTGRGDDPRTLLGVGHLHVEGANVFAIPFMGPLSGVLGEALPNFGMDVAHEASAYFQTNGGKIYTGNVEVKGAVFNLSGAGWIGYASDGMNMRVRVNSRGLPGAVLNPVSKLLEYSSQGPLARPVWKPRLLSGQPAIDPAAASLPTASPAPVRERGPNRP